MIPFAIGVLIGLALGSALLYVHRHPHRRPEPDAGLDLLEQLQPITFEHKQIGTDPQGRPILAPVLSDAMRRRLPGTLDVGSDQDSTPGEDAG